MIYLFHVYASFEDSVESRHGLHLQNTAFRSLLVSTEHALPRRSSRASARLTQQHQSFPPARRVIQGRQLVGRHLQQGFQIRDDLRALWGGKQGATSGILLRMLSAHSVLQTMVNRSGS